MNLCAFQDILPVGRNTIKIMSLSSKVTLNLDNKHSRNRIKKSREITSLKYDIIVSIRVLILKADDLND